MKLLTVDTIEQAQQKLFECAQKAELLKTTTLPIEHAVGRVCAHIVSPGDIPSFARSTVDGYAVRARDTQGATESVPAFLNIVDFVKMGEKAGVPVKDGECAYVPTGGMIPAGADAVVMIEYTERFGSGKLAVYDSAASGANVALAGEDIARGQTLIPSGAVLRAEEIGALASAGVVQVPVYEPIRIAVISTGDELVPPHCEPQPGQIRDVNSYALKTLAAQSGFITVAFHVLKDDEEILEQTISGAMQFCSIVIVSGGSSQGEKDCTARAISRASSPGLLTHGIAIKPGKPVILGWDEQTKTILAGLPGHPVSAMIVFRILFCWLWKKLTGQREDFPIPAKLSCNVASSPGRTTIQPVTLALQDEYVADPVFGKSGMLTSLTKAHGYIIIDSQKEGVKKGESVLVHLL
jgi:molybdopterin molybdotransferase